MAPNSQNSHNGAGRTVLSPPASSSVDYCWNRNVHLHCSLSYCVAWWCSGRVPMLRSTGREFELVIIISGCKEPYVVSQSTAASSASCKRSRPPSKLSMDKSWRCVTLSGFLHSHIVRCWWNRISCGTHYSGPSLSENDSAVTADVCEDQNREVGLWDCGISDGNLKHTNKSSVSVRFRQGQGLVRFDWSLVQVRFSSVWFNWNSSSGSVRFGFSGMVWYTRV